ncbi:hypothetical protein EYF80_040759 [Liparis tanakae]|uniref:Uncharacterized protein n=1 Tax=Liparis tanakae TaxID=230148 RepID=A0A4Z2G730_9TELE|nr:hypothetical protein EYF80_040759 [Liparis tanakae]
MQTLEDAFDFHIPPAVCFDSGRPRRASAGSVRRAEGLQKRFKFKPFPTLPPLSGIADPALKKRYVRCPDVMDQRGVA